MKLSKMETLAAQAAEDEKYISDYARICEDAVATWGNQAQILMAVEEMSELTKALLKFFRYGARKDVLDSIQEEHADVQIMNEPILPARRREPDAACGLHWACILGLTLAPRRMPGKEGSRGENRGRGKKT